MINKDKYDYILMSLLQIPSIQETLEHIYIENQDISLCTSAFELLVEFKSIKTVKIIRYYSKDDKLEEWKLKINQFEEILKKKHPKINIYIWKSNI